MSYISILLPTCRPGGLDVLFAGLQNQTFRDFELVWCDAIRGYREPCIQGELAKANFPITYVDPIDNIFPYAGFARCANTALANANGEISLIIADYLYLPSDCLEKHAAHHKQHAHSGYMGPHTYLETPKLKPLPMWGDAGYPYSSALDRDQKPYNYVDDLRSGKYNHAMWSTFENQIISDPSVDFQKHPEWARLDPKLAAPSGPTTPAMFHCKNESFPTECALAINGWDEDFNGSHGWQDTEFAERLSLHQQLAWVSDQSNVVYGFSIKDDIPRLRKLRPTLSNRSLLELKRATGYKDPVNDWNLRDIRQRNTS